MSCSLCDPADAQGSNASDVLKGDVIELYDLFTPRDFALSGNRIYALDPRDKRLTVYNLDGTFIRGFGSGGEGPGEFRNPVSLDVYGKHVAVTERSGRTSLFDSSGAFLHSFRTDGILHINSHMRFLSDTLIFIGGLREEPGTLYGGMMGHIFTIDGVRTSAFMPLSHKARNLESDLIIGASCDFDENRSLWCGQITDYVIRRFDYDGTKADSLTVTPSYYRPLSQRQPRSDRTRTEALNRWIDSWDKTMELYTINDSLLLYNVSTGEGVKIDLIDNRDGSVVATHDVAWGRLVYVSKEAQLLLIRRPSNGEPLTRLELVPISALLNGAD